jgi:hypothetical protein
VGCPLSWWRAALLILLLNTTFFYHGCDRNNTYFSVGAVSPFMVVAVENDASWPSRLLSVSPVALTAGLLVTIVAVLVICRYVPWLSRRLASRTCLVALSLSVAVLNSFLASPTVWRYIAWMPTTHLVDLSEWVLYGDDASASAGGCAAVIIASRLYFFLLIACLYPLIRLCSFLVRRYLLVESGHWWQFRLGGLVATAVILGTGIGLVVRLMMQGQ